MESDDENLITELKKMYSVFLYGNQIMEINSLKFIMGFIICIALFALGLISWNNDTELALFSFLQGSFGIMGLLYFYNHSGDENFRKSTEYRVPQKIDSMDREISSYQKIFTYFIWFFCALYILLKLLGFEKFPNHFALTSSEIILILYALFVSITEEIFFRGFLITPFLVKKYNSNLHSIITIFLSLLLQSIIWTLLHINYYRDLTQLIPIFASGILFSIIYIYTKKIKYTIVLHIIGNFFASLILYCTI